MDNKELLMAVESVIRRFVKDHFVNNNISPIEARLILKSIYADYTESSLDEFVMRRVQTGSNKTETD